LLVEVAFGHVIEYLGLAGCERGTKVPRLYPGKVLELLKHLAATLGWERKVSLRGYRPKRPADDVMSSSDDILRLTYPPHAP